MQNGKIHVAVLKEDADGNLEVDSVFEIAIRRIA